MYLKFRLQSPFSTPQLGSVLFGQTDKKNFSFAKGTKRKTTMGTNYFHFIYSNLLVYGIQEK